MSILISIFILGYHGKTTDFAKNSSCHRTTIAHFLNSGKWDDSLLSDTLKCSVIEIIYSEAARTGKPVFCIVDDTIASKTKPSSRALHPIEDAKKQQKNGLVTVVGTKKNHFMSDTKWLLQHGFKEIEKLPNGFSLLVMSFHENSAVPYFNDCVKSGECPDKLGIVAYYSNRCPYTDYYVNGVLRVLAQEINIPLKVIKLETREQAQNSPTPATIFSLFYNGKFVTTDLSICTESKFTKLLK